MRDQSAVLRYLIEFRSRALRCLLLFVLIYVCCFYYRNAIYGWLAKPIMSLVEGPHAGVMATSVFAPLMVPMKAAAFIAFLCVLPYAFYQLWAFVSPALYHHEKAGFCLLSLVSLCLFFLGGALGAGIFFPALCHLMYDTLPSGVVMMLDMGAYLSNFMQITISLGLIFQLPVIVVMLLHTGVLTLKQCQQYRRYWIVLSFVIAAILAPPDVLSQCVFAIPLCVLYECGLLLYRLCTYTFALEKK